MAEKERPPGLGQPDVTVTEYLYQFQTPLYEGRGQFAVEDSLSGSTTSGSVFLAPKHQGLPMVSAQARKTPHGGAVDFSISPQGIPVSYSREYRYGDMPSTKDIVQGEVGPFRGFFSELRGGGERDPVQRAYGASARTGPVTLYGEQSDASREGRKKRNRKIGAAIGGPFGSGVAGLDVARTYRESLQPNWRGQPRPTVSAPHTTSFRGHWQGPLGPGRLGLQGGVTSERGIGTSSNLGANYVIEDPLGLGGRLNAHAGWQNPYGEPSNWQAGVRYGLRW